MKKVSVIYHAIQTVYSMNLPSIQTGPSRSAILGTHHNYNNNIIKQSLNLFIVRFTEYCIARVTIRYTIFVLYCKDLKAVGVFGSRKYIRDKVTS